MQNNKISSRPPSKNAITDFILGAEQKGQRYNTNKKEESYNIYPWQDSSVRDDVQKAFTIKIPEEYVLKIKFISDKTNKSQQKIVREIICAEIDKIISRLT